MIFVASCLTSFHFIFISFVMLRQVFQISLLNRKRKTHKVSLFENYLKLFPLCKQMSKIISEIEIEIDRRGSYRGILVTRD